MSGAVHILVGPAGSGKTHRLLARLRAVPASAGPGAALWLGPTRRNLAGVQDRLAGQGALAGVSFRTLDDFAGDIIRRLDPRARPFPGVPRRLLIESLLARLHRDKELTHFDKVAESRGLLHGMMDLLAELERRGVDPDAFTAAAGGSEGDEPARPKAAQCALVYSRFRDLLQRHHLVTQDGRCREALRLLTASPPDNPHLPGAILVDGFWTFEPAQCDLLRALAARAGEFWLALPGEPPGDRPDLFSSAQAVLAAFADLSPRVDVLPHPTNGTPTPVPAGLRHLQRQLFRPPRAVQRSADADGLLLLHAPGLVGEVRLAAREVKTLLLHGTPADEVLLVVRDLRPYADLVREVFAEAGIPLDIEGGEPLARQPAVAALVRAARLPDEGWPFAAVAALLRGSDFRPDWPEAAPRAGLEPDMPLRAESLLRLLRIPRGRDAFLHAVDVWSDTPPPPPDDEQAEASRQERKQRLANECRPFLRRFFAAWDAAPERGPLSSHAAWLRALADDLGLARAAAADPVASAALDRLWAELDAWEKLDAALDLTGKALDRAAFFRTLHAVAAEAVLPRTPRGPGRVRLVSAELARGLAADHVFVLGLGEGSFPRPGAAGAILDEAERTRLRGAGADLAGLADRLPDEMLLFYALLTRARRRLVLSYSAVDERGQDLLPSSFLAAARDAFEPGAVPVLRRRLLIEGYDRDIPLSPAEFRVQAAVRMARGGTAPLAGPRELADRLRAAARVARARFHESEFTPHDGRLRDPAALAEIAAQFPPERIYSPTALETYIACPFRFFLQHVLHLEPLDEPDEDIEGSERGLVFHRALTSLHRQLGDRQLHAPSDEVSPLLSRLMDQEVTWHRARSGLAAAALWRLEGQRLQRKAARYLEHWRRFVTTWADRGLSPCPRYLEQAVGVDPPPGQPTLEPLILRGDGLEVRLGGRIDRVDVAETDQGILFWIVDYKTGRSSHYTATDVRSFQRLQLMVYALAVQQVLFAGQPARPAGLAYWLVTDTGPKLVLPGKALSWVDGETEWTRLRPLLEDLVLRLVASLRGGEFPLAPRRDDCTATCPYAQVCRITQGRAVEKAWTLPLPTLS